MHVFESISTENVLFNVAFNSGNTKIAAVKIYLIIIINCNYYYN